MSNTTPTVYVFCNDDCRYEGMTKEQIITAIAEATGATPTSIDDAFITKIKEMNGNKAIKMWVGTMAKFSALSTKEEDMLYIFSDDDSGDSWEAIAEFISGVIDGSVTVPEAVNAAKAVKLSDTVSGTLSEALVSRSTDYYGNDIVYLKGTYKESSGSYENVGVNYAVYGGIALSTSFTNSRWETFSGSAPEDVELAKSKTYEIKFGVTVGSTAKNFYAMFTTNGKIDRTEIVQTYIFYVGSTEYRIQLSICSSSESETSWLEILDVTGGGSVSLDYLKYRAIS